MVKEFMSDEDYQEYVEYLKDNSKIPVRFNNKKDNWKRRFKGDSSKHFFKYLFKDSS
jgi:hypothetical protein